jgi:two-component system cell cycle response regulator CpdR
VGHGADALPVIAEGRFDLLLADIVMPEMDGIELAQRAAETDKNIRVIFITGFAGVALNRSTGDRTQAKVLSKPFHLRELVSEVDRTLAARAAEGVRPL